MKVALVYDRVNKWGGAERILLALHKLFPDAPLYTSVYDKKSAPWADVFNVKTSFLQHVPFAGKHHELFAFLMPFAFESFSFNDFDLVISVSSESAKGIITSGKTKHICYILTPTRYLWSGYDEYFKNNLLRFVSLPVVWYLRFWDKQASRRPDTYIAISKEVKRRVKKYYGRDSTVVYPPVELSTINYKLSTIPDKDFFLVVSRLVAYKRVDIAIKVCNALKLPLKIVGIGLEEKNLRKLAGPTVEFVGNLTDEELVGYYKNCRALIFPGCEDFGLTVVEAQRFGKPVLAFQEGGALETLVEGKTGEFFYPQTSQSLEKVLRNFDDKKYDPKDCKKQAEKFTFNAFKKAFMKSISGL